MRGALAASLGLVALLGAARADAQGASADALFDEGLKLFDAGKVHEACERFQASFRLDPALGTLQNLATCHEQDGKTASAWREFSDLAERAKKAGAGQRAREILGQKRAEALAKKLSNVQLHAGAASNVVEVRVDGEALDRARWSSPFPLDPGAHTFVFAAPGKIAATQVVDVSATPGTTTVELPNLADVPPPPPPPSRGVPLRTMGLAIGGAGAFGFVLTGIFGGLTFAKKNAGAAHCMGVYCDPQGLALESAAHGYATASTTSFVLGLAAAGTGAFLFVWGGRSTRTALRITPTTGGARGAVSW